MNQDRVGRAENPLTEGVVDHLSTTISRNNGGSMAATLNRTHGKVTGTIRGNKDMLESFRTIGTLCERIGLNKLVADSASQLYKRCWDADVLKRKPTQFCIAACIFIACRQEKVARQFVEISKLTDVEMKHLKRSIHTVITFLHESQGGAGGSSAVSGAVDGTAETEKLQGSSALPLIPRLCSLIGVDAAFSGIVEVVV